MRTRNDVHIIAVNACSDGYRWLVPTPAERKLLEPFVSSKLHPRIPAYGPGGNRTLSDSLVVRWNDADGNWDALYSWNLKRLKLLPRKMAAPTAWVKLRIDVVEGFGEFDVRWSVEDFGRSEHINVPEVGVFPHPQSGLSTYAPIVNTTSLFESEHVAPSKRLKERR